jgi:hypothetical protein
MLLSAVQILLHDIRELYARQLFNVLVVFACYEEADESPATSLW